MDVTIILYMSDLKIPDGFNEIKLSRGLAIVKSKYRDIIEKEIIPIIGEFPASKTSQITGGRKGLYRFKLESTELHTVVVRPCMRGGFLGPLLKDIYWSKKRLISELVISDLALNKGLAVPEIIGIVLEPKGLGFYKGFVIMREIYNSVNLSDYLKTVVAHDKAKLFHRKKDLIEAVSNSLVQFHNHGFYHSDLNMTNLLVQRDDSGEIKVWIIDLDKAKHYKELSLGKRISNLIRLNRSIIKLGLDKIITSRDRLRFVKTYLEKIGKETAGLIAKISHQCATNMRNHKLWWMIKGK